MILDEPTNHLDIPGKEALEESLKGFTGSVLFVSHDRYFIQQLATGLIRFEDGKAEFINKTYDEYMQSDDAKPLFDEKQEQQESSSEKTRRQISPEARRREIAKLEKQITEKEAELEDMRALRFEPEFYQDYTKMNELDQDIDDIHNEIAHLEKRWEELLEEES